MKKLKAKPTIMAACTSILLLSGASQYYSYEKYQDLKQHYCHLKTKHDQVSHDLHQTNFLNRKLQNEKGHLLKQKQDIYQQLQNAKEEIQQKDLSIEQLKKEIDSLKTSKANSSFSTNVVRYGEKEGEWTYFLATYYDANEPSTGKHPGDPAYGITASGKPVQNGITIAVDPNIIPLGSWVLIKYPDGHLEKRRADDTGSAITGYRIDIYISNASITSGKHPVQVKIL